MKLVYYKVSSAKLSNSFRQFDTFYWISALLFCSGWASNVSIYAQPLSIWAHLAKTQRPSGSASKVHSFFHMKTFGNHHKIANQTMHYFAWWFRKFMNSKYLKIYYHKAWLLAVPTALEYRKCVIFLLIRPCSAWWVRKFMNFLQKAYLKIPHFFPIF